MSQIRTKLWRVDALLSGAHNPRAVTTRPSTQLVQHTPHAGDPSASGLNDESPALAARLRVTRIAPLAELMAPPVTEVPTRAATPRTPANSRSSQRLRYIGVASVLVTGACFVLQLLPRFADAPFAVTWSVGREPPPLPPALPTPAAIAPAPPAIAPAPVAPAPALAARPRAAVDALAAGDWPLALHRYRALLREHPHDDAYRQAVHVLGRRVLSADDIHDQPRPMP